jgi:putative ABC transport system substrate-binding protein
MRRREFLGVLGGAAATWPLAARAQQTERMRRIGILMGYTENDSVAQARVAEFRRGLQELGWTEDRNVRFEYRWPGADPRRIRAHAAEIVELAPDVILSSPAQVTLELNRLTKSLPILFVNVPDPVDLGLVASLAHPGGNMTGFANFEHALAGKWLDILKQMIPSATNIGVFYSRENPAWRGRLRVIEEAAPSLGVRLTAIGVSEVAEVEGAFDSFAQQKIGALIVLPSIFAATHRAPIVALADRHRFPAIYPFRFFVADGGLLAYGIDLNDQFRRAASYVDRILKGEKPGDLPVQAPTKFELVINLKTAKNLGLDVPPTLLALADEVIE